MDACEESERAIESATQPAASAIARARACNPVAKPTTLVLLQTIFALSGVAQTPRPGEAAVALTPADASPTIVACAPSATTVAAGSPLSLELALQKPVGRRALVSPIEIEKLDQDAGVWRPLIVEPRPADIVVEAMRDKVALRVSVPASALLAMTPGVWRARSKVALAGLGEEWTTHQQITVVAHEVNRRLMSGEAGVVAQEAWTMCVENQSLGGLKPPPRQDMPNDFLVLQLRDALAGLRAAGAADQLADKAERIVLESEILGIQELEPGAVRDQRIRVLKQRLVAHVAESEPGPGPLGGQRGEAQRLRLEFLKGIRAPEVAKETEALAASLPWLSVGP